MEDARLQSSPARLKAIWRHPLGSLGLLALGMGVAGLGAPCTGEEILAAQGAELALLALIRLLIFGQTRIFFWALLGCALAVPLAAGCNAPLYYFRDAGLFSGPFWELSLLGLMPAVPLAAMAVWGLRWSRRPRPEPEPDPGWLGCFGWVVEAGLMAMVLALATGAWSELSVALVVSGAMIFLSATIALLVVRVRLNRRGVANLLAIIGGSGLLSACLLVASQGGRVSWSEASVALVPGACLLALGLVLRGGRRGRCAACGHAISTTVQRCGRCGAVYHLECWRLIDGCSCTRAAPASERLAIQPGSLVDKEPDETPREAP
ncbi:MAG: hypothetical protein JXR96_26930 [Deltaproteobacteria bacterium]|nr:hypothetical protein [Deltaproteobacteria bacterium]